MSLLVQHLLLDPFRHSVILGSPLLLGPAATASDSASPSESAVKSIMAGPSRSRLLSFSSRRFRFASFLSFFFSFFALRFFSAAAFCD